MSDEPHPLYDALLRLAPGDLPTITLESFFDRPAWHADAACRGVGPSVFFIERGGSTDPAKALCAECPVSDRCRSSALANDEEGGIWAGQTAKNLQRHRSAA